MLGLGLGLGLGLVLGLGLGLAKISNFAPLSEFSQFFHETKF